MNEAKPEERPERFLRKAAVPAHLADKVHSSRWAYDPDNGEFFRITSRSRDGYLVETYVYTERMAERLKLRRSILTTSIPAVVAIPLLVFGYVMVQPDWHQQNYFAIFFLGNGEGKPIGIPLLLFGATFFVLGVGGGLLALINWYDYDVGPPPVSAQGDDDGEDEKFRTQSALGAARLATEDEVQAALSRKSAPAAPRRFED